MAGLGPLIKSRQPLVAVMADSPQDKVTPMLRQYLDLKSRYADALLLFQMGDFYETFFEDTEKMAAALNIALTSRSRAERRTHPHGRLPHPRGPELYRQIAGAGFKVVVCDQMEDPAQAKGLVRREVTRVLTRGTLVDPAALDARRDNYLAALTFRAPSWGLAYLSLSTGEFRLTQGEGADGLGDELWRLKPAELILPEDADQALLTAALAPFDTPPTRRLLAATPSSRRRPGGSWAGPWAPCSWTASGWRTTPWGWPRPGPSSAICTTPTPRHCPTWTGCCLTPGMTTWGWTKPPCGTWRFSRPGAAAPARARCWTSWTAPSPPWGPGDWAAGCGIP